jgi:ERCC4-related helicase
VVEEGLDIPDCNLVFRFNKPPNFSSYMQSKGRARAKENASYVLLIAEPDPKKFEAELSDYRNYEEIEQVSILTSNRNSSAVSFSITFRCFTTSSLSVMTMIPTGSIWICWNPTELKAVL